MWWLPLVTMAKGAIDAKAAGDKQERYNKGQAEVTRYSPLTGQTGQMDNTSLPSTFSGAVAGGIQGLGIQQGLEKGMTPEDTTTPDLSKVGGGVNMQSGAGALGGQAMASQMGQDFSQPVAGGPVDYSKMQLSQQQPNYFASK
mgnify:CR=1 FL=1